MRTRLWQRGRASALTQKAVSSLEDVLELVPLLGVGRNVLNARTLGLVAVKSGLLEAALEHGTLDVGGDVAGVLPQHSAAERASEDLDGSEDETRADLDEDRLALLLSTAVGIVGNLVVAEPDAAVEVEEGEDVVDEGLDLGVALRGREALGEELLHQKRVGRIREGLVEVHDGAGALEAVTSELDLRHGVDVLDKKLDAGAARCASSPQVEVLVLASLEEEAVVAVGHLGNVVHLGQVIWSWE